jgi:hypothetical protein
MKKLYLITFSFADDRRWQPFMDKLESHKVFQLHKAAFMIESSDPQADFGDIVNFCEPTEDDSVCMFDISNSSIYPFQTLMAVSEAADGWRKGNLSA